MHLTKEELMLGEAMRSSNIINNIHVFFKRTNDLYHDVDFRGKSVLDIGGGAGIYSFYSEIKGAEYVICLEPYGGGSNNKMKNTFKEIQKIINSKNVFMVNDTIQSFNTDNIFDIVISQASINHFDEEACRNLKNNRNYYERYLKIFQKIYNLMDDNGQLIISDVARRNFWGDIGVRNPFSPTLDWKLHHSPKTWGEISENAGFIIRKVEWKTINRLLKYKRVLQPFNKSISYFITSHFDLFCVKKVNA